MLNECSLVLECVTLAQVVEFVVEVFVDFPRGTVFGQETTEDTKTAHPNNLSVDRVSIYRHGARMLMQVQIVCEFVQME